MKKKNLMQFYWKKVSWDHLSFSSSSACSVSLYPKGIDLYIEEANLLFSFCLWLTTELYRTLHLWTTVCTFSWRSPVKIMNTHITYFGVLTGIDAFSLNFKRKWYWYCGIIWKCLEKRSIKYFLINI